MSDLLRISCPQCRRRFQVPERFVGQKVECETCENRFRVERQGSSDKSKRFAAKSTGDRFVARNSVSNQSISGEQAEVGFAKASYVANPNVEAVLPASPAQRGAVLFGLPVLVLLLVVFFVGTGRDGFFQDVSRSERWVLWGFGSLVGVTALLWGAKSWRFRASVLAFGLVGGAALLVATRPVFMTPGAGVDEVKVAQSRSNLSEKEPLPGSARQSEIERLKSKVGYSQVERAIEEMGGDESKVLAVYMEPWEESYLHPLQNYFTRVLQLPTDAPGSFYRRNLDEAVLFVFQQVDQSFDTALEQFSELGRLRQHRDLRLIEVVLDKQLLEYSENEDLLDPTSLDFISLNVAELRHFDLARAGAAAQRLGLMPESAPKPSKGDVGEALVELLRKSDSEELDQEIGAALNAWVPDYKTLGEKVGEIVLERYAERPPGKALVDYLTVTSAPQSVEVIDRLWQSNPLRWLPQYQVLGARAESKLIPHLQSERDDLRKNATILLQAIGTLRAVPALEKAKKTADVNLKEALADAITAIRERS